jgi:quinol monooxygenase YgiN
MKTFTTSQDVYWLLALKINPGQAAEFKALSERLIESSQEEPGTLHYEWSLSEDGEVCHVHERFADSAAVKIHGQRSHELVGKLMTVSKPLSFALYGAPDAEVKQMFAAMNPLLTKPLGGFGR